MKFPVELVNGKAILVRTDEMVTKQAIIDRLMSMKNDLFFQQSYGSDIHRLIFEQNDEVLQSLIRHYVIESLQAEDRIRFKSIVFLPINAQKIGISLDYQIIKTNLLQNIEFTFNKQTDTDSAGFSTGFSFGFNS